MCRSISGRVSTRSTSVTPRLTSKPPYHNSADLHNSTTSSGSHGLDLASPPPTRLEAAEVHSDSSMSGSRSLGSPRLEHGLSADSEGGDFLSQPVDIAAVDARLPRGSDSPGDDSDRDRLPPTSSPPLPPPPSYFQLPPTTDDENVTDADIDDDFDNDDDNLDANLPAPVLSANQNDTALDLGGEGSRVMASIEGADRLENANSLSLAAQRPQDTDSRSVEGQQVRAGMTAGVKERQGRPAGKAGSVGAVTSEQPARALSSQQQAAVTTATPAALTPADLDLNLKGRQAAAVSVTQALVHATQAGDFASPCSPGQGSKVTPADSIRPQPPVEASDLNDDIPYVLHRRQYTEGDELLSPSPAPSPQGSLLRQSRSQSPRLQEARSRSDRSPSAGRRLELVRYNKLPARDSFSSVDDTTSPTAPERDFLHKGGGEEVLGVRQGGEGAVGGADSGKVKAEVKGQEVASSKVPLPSSPHCQGGEGEGLAMAESVGTDGAPASVQTAAAGAESSERGRKEDEVKVKEKVKIYEEVKVEENRIYEEVKVEENVKIYEEVKVEENAKIYEEIKVEEKVQEEVVVEGKLEVDTEEPAKVKEEVMVEEKSKVEEIKVEEPLNVKEEVKADKKVIEIPKVEEDVKVKGVKVKDEVRFADQPDVKVRPESPPLPPPPLSPPLPPPPPRPQNPTAEREPNPIPVQPTLTTFSTSKVTVARPTVAPKPAKPPPPPVAPKSTALTKKPPVAPKSKNAPCKPRRETAPPAPPATGNSLMDDSDFPPPPSDLTVVGGSSPADVDLESLPPPPSELLLGLSRQSPSDSQSPPPPPQVNGRQLPVAEKEKERRPGSIPLSATGDNSCRGNGQEELGNALTGLDSEDVRQGSSQRKEGGAKLPVTTTTDSSEAQKMMDLPSPAAALILSEADSPPSQIKAPPPTLTFTTFRPDPSESDADVVASLPSDVGAGSGSYASGHGSSPRDPRKRWSLERVEEEPANEETAERTGRESQPIGDEEKGSEQLKGGQHSVRDKEKEAAVSFHSDVSLTVATSPGDQGSSLGGSHHSDNFDNDPGDVMAMLESLRQCGSESDLTYSGSSGSESGGGGEDGGQGSEVYLQYAAARGLSEAGRDVTADSGMGEMSGEGTLGSQRRESSPLDLLERLGSLEGSFISDQRKASIEEFPPPPPFLCPRGSTPSSSSSSETAGATATASAGANLDPLLTLEGDLGDVAYTTSESESDFDEEAETCRLRRMSQCEGAAGGTATGDCGLDLGPSAAPKVPAKPDAGHS